MADVCMVSFALKPLCLRKQTKHRLKGKGNIERKYVYLDTTFQAKKFDTGLSEIDQ